MKSLIHYISDFSMTIKEIEDIEAGLRILAYECDEFLNGRFYGTKLFDLYFLYGGFISNIKRIHWTFPNVRQTLEKFPKLTQPALFVFVPLILYSFAVFFASTFFTLIGFLSVIAVLLFFAYFKIKIKLKEDLTKVIHLCGELRLQLHQVKNLNLKGEL